MTPPAARRLRTAIYTVGCCAAAGLVLVGALRWDEPAWWAVAGIVIGLTNIVAFAVSRRAQ